MWCHLPVSCHLSVLAWPNQCDLFYAAEDYGSEKHADLHSAKWDGMYSNILVFLAFCT